jgi:uncharacterized lipoprotein YddW (UPF0748 family)
MRKLKLILLFLTIFTVIGITSNREVDSSTELEILQRDGSNVTHFGSTDPVMIPVTYTEKSNEFRGVWVTTVYNLNMPQHTSETQYKAAFQDLVDEVLAANMNVIVFQVRPQSDAFYDSAYAPWSRWLTGTEGVNPGWDLIQYMIDTSHANGIEFHAWLNPYRVANSSSSEATVLSGLHSENFAKQNPDLVIAGDLDSNSRYPYILNPGEPAVKTYIRDVITELITIYDDIDGIHFDDYFYPSYGMSSDTATYNTYKSSGQTIEDWRRENVNDIVRGIKEDIDAYNVTNSTSIRFGISPSGIWKSGLPDGSNTSTSAHQSYPQQFADTKKWVEEEWVHYICPQIYRDFTHSLVPYADLVDWWVSVVRGTNVDLIIGQGIYKNNDWIAGEIKDHLRYNQKHPEIIGEMMYSASYLDLSQMTDVVNDYWTAKPINIWETSGVGDPTIEISGTGNYPYYQNATITLSTDSSSLLYKINDGSWITYTTPIILTTEGEYIIYYKNVESSVEFNETIYIDLTAPNDPNINIVGDFDGKYYIEEISVELITDDSNNKIMFRLHNGSTWSEWADYVDPLDIIFNATYTLEWYAVDQALNVSDTKDIRIKMDIPPNEHTINVVRDGKIVNYYETSNPIILPSEYTEKTEEIRAVWVATVGSIDIGYHISEADYKAKLIRILDVVEANNFNTIFFQVRPMNDAFYPSSYAPFSRYLTGIEGVDPGWDVLEFLIEEAHLRGIEVHAWLNPYRVSTGTTSKESQLALLHDDNFAKQNPDLVLADKQGKLILNPGEAQVQAYIKNVISELIAKYDIDGIHFDDYFYSYNGMYDTEDAETYENNKLPGQSLDDWRRENINTIVEDIFNIIESHNTTNDKNVKFGISPFGIWASGGTDGSNTSPYALQSYKDQYADSKKWVEEGWLHYILPQLYWEFEHNAAPFADLVDWWADLCDDSGVDLIVGHGFYRYDNDTWDNDNELLEQMRYISQYDSVIGSSFFTYNTLLSLDPEVVQAIDRLNNYYWTEYATFPWESDVVKADPVCEVDQTLIDGECIDNPPVCTVDQTLIDGECIDNPPVCTVDQTLVDGECIDNPPVCEIDQTLVDGECIDNEPVCETDQTLLEGECVDNSLICDSGYNLVDGECQLVYVQRTGCFSTIGSSKSIVVLLTSFGGAIFFIYRKFVLK